MRRRDLHRRPRLHPPNYTCSPACTSQRDPHRCLGSTRSIYEADILAGGRQSYPHLCPHLPLLCAHSARASILGFLAPLVVLTQVPQSRISQHASTCSELWMDSGPYGTLAVATIEVSPFTLLAPLIADVPRPLDSNLRIYLRRVILPQQTS